MKLYGPVITAVAVSEKVGSINTTWVALVTPTDRPVLSNFLLVFLNCHFANVRTDSPWHSDRVYVIIKGLWMSIVTFCRSNNGPLVIDLEIKNV